MPQADCDHTNSTFFFSNCLIEDVTSAKLDTNLETYVTIPKSTWSSFLSFGSLNCKIALVLPLSARNPSFVKTCPTYFTSLNANLHLLRLNRTFALFALFSTASSRLVCSSSLPAQTMMSSIYTSTLGNPSKIFLNVR